MMHFRTPLFGISLLFVAVAGYATGRDSVDNPYQRIPSRNVFGLVVPIVEPGPTPPAQPLPTIKLTGITTILGDKRAVLKIQFPGTGREEGCILSEGQRLGQIEILEIDDRTATVKVDNSGTVIVLTFASKR
jgi:hypothetical protein